MQNNTNRRKKYALASFGLGALNLIPCCCVMSGIPAILLGWLALASSGPALGSGALWLARGGIALGLFSNLAWLILPWIVH